VLFCKVTSANKTLDFLDHKITQETSYPTYAQYALSPATSPQASGSSDDSVTSTCSKSSTQERSHHLTRKRHTKLVTSTYQIQKKPLAGKRKSSRTMIQPTEARYNLRQTPARQARGTIKWKINRGVQYPFGIFTYTGEDWVVILSLYNVCAASMCCSKHLSSPPGYAVMSIMLTTSKLSWFGRYAKADCFLRRTIRVHMRIDICLSIISSTRSWVDGRHISIYLHRHTHIQNTRHIYTSLLGQV